ncbi:MAG TPA: 7TM diverse intracellular signaling domain-containing protein [Oligoflexus sp.]|uniref:7TM diverse intracellular signaling domain-containing protein n=1 Tax=Oligoflexus sp. TaxID=1971216 RepID=UPI002D584977|nr:7TM diverse intracellular signaling domain-containing protein [Oligoflexus sp.]HYX32082.1 7TM diverse intracellular signaling domain-containing protein [Oligoflexus sp.]
MKSVLAIIMLLWFCPATPQALGNVTARDGVLDLRGQNLEQPIRADGIWDFYWNQLLTPADLSHPDLPKESIKVPGLWSQDSRKYPTMGYATYRLRVLVDPGKKLALFTDASTWSASRIFIDGEEVAELGKVGTTPETSAGGVATRTFEFQPKAPEFDLIIQVSNFEIFLCGITIAPQFGTLETVVRDRNQKIAIDVFLVGALIIMGIYHLCLFLLRREDPSTFWFGAVCCGTALWHAASRNGLAMLFIPDLGFDTRLRVYNAAWIVGVGSFAWYFHFIFRNLFARWVAWSFSAITLAFVAVMAVTSPRIFVSLANIFHFFSVLIMLYSMYTVIRAWRRREEGSQLMLMGIGIPIAAALHDFLAIREIISSPLITAGGVFAFILFQSFFLARRFSNAFVRVKQSEKEIRTLSEDLKALNNNLEKLVEEKIRDIRSIMEHIPLGILMINRNRKVHKDHSKRIYEFLDRSKLETAEATDLVFAASNLESEQISQAVSCLSASLGEDAVNFVMNQHLLPSEILRQDGPDRQRIVELTWDPIVAADNSIDKILVTMRDVTDLRQLQERSRDQQKELEYIAEIINIPADRFQHFLETSDELLDQSRSLLDSARRKGQNSKILKLLFINMHTLKGSARSLYLKQLSQMFHEVEQGYVLLQDNTAWDISTMQRQIEDVQKLLDFYKFIAQHRLGRNPEQAHMVEYRIEDIEPLYRELKAFSGPAASVVEKVRALFYGKIFKDARLVFEDLFSSIPLLARDLGKENPQIRLDTRNIFLSRRAEEIFRKVFIHLIRNAMDHGLETADERKLLGKNPVGTIYVHMQRMGDHLELRCYDDGRGLNLRRLQDVAVQGGPLPNLAVNNPQAVAALIFHPGMTTARELSDISGRGIGMNAVQAFIEDNQGFIAVELDPHARTAPDHTAFRLVIQLPFVLFEEAGLMPWALGKPA